jgi:hypothetical protein
MSAACVKPSLHNSKGIQTFTQSEKSRDLLAFSWVMMRFRLDDELFFDTAYFYKKPVLASD